jgi:hypothetical protein
MEDEAVKRLRACFIPGSLLFVLTSALLVLGCSNDTPTSPTPTTPTTVTDTFSGTIAKNGAATHNFTVSTTGSVTATLTALGPDAKDPDGNPLVVGFGLGTWNGTSCKVVIAQDRAIQTTVLYGNVNASGSLCVRVFDVGNLADQVDYTTTVVHP